MVKAQPRDSQYGYTIEDYLGWLPNHMDDIGYGFHRLVPQGRQGFGLSGVPLLNFLRACLRTLLDAGAVPVEDHNNWARKTRWGDDKAAIIEGMISDWLDSGAPEVPEWGKHWLMWPKYLRD